MSAFLSKVVEIAADARRVKRKPRSCSGATVRTVP